MNRYRAIVKITKTIKAHNLGNYKTKKWLNVYEYTRQANLFNSNYSS